MAEGKGLVGKAHGGLFAARSGVISAGLTCCVWIEYLSFLQSFPLLRCYQVVAAAEGTPGPSA